MRPCPKCGEEDYEAAYYDVRAYFIIDEEDGSVTGRPDLDYEDATCVFRCCSCSHEIAYNEQDFMKWVAEEDPLEWMKGDRK